MVLNWAINGTLPSGLSFGANNGTVYGTPTELWPQTPTWWANNSGGSTVTYLNITVIDQLPTVTYTPADLTSPTTPSVSTCRWNPSSPVLVNSPRGPSSQRPPALPSRRATAPFRGTPSELWPTTPYVVWANNGGGSTAAYLNITVVDQLPSIAYAPATLSLANNTVSSDLPLVPSVSGPGEITSWELNASLPTGLTFETSNGTIWERPPSCGPTEYTVWANNSGGQAWLTSASPSSISYQPSPTRLKPSRSRTTPPVAICRWKQPFQVRVKSHRGSSTPATNRPHVRDQQRHDLGNADPVVAHHTLHDLGQQQRWVQRGLPQHHGDRPSADRFVFA